MDPEEQPIETDHEKAKIERLRRVMYSRAYGDRIKNRDRRKLSDNPEVVGEDWTRPEDHAPASIIAPRGITIVRSFLYWLLLAAAVFFAGSMVFFVYYFTFGGGSLAA